MDEQQERTYEWEIRNFTSLSEKQYSDEFEACFFTWRLSCFPKQNTQPNAYVSLFLECMDAKHIPDGHGPQAEFDLIVRNHLDSTKDVRKVSSHQFFSSQVDWGFSQTLPLADATTEAGFIRASDGALVVAVELKLSCKRRKTGRSVGSDLLTLLDQPGTTSDLTITAGDRSFSVHRPILAARCEYFRTLFDSGFSEAASRTVHLPDADPDALALLLRLIYGGELPAEGCPRALLKPAAELADRLRLGDAYEMLTEHIEATCTLKTIVDDMLWASRLGNDKLLTSLESTYLANPDQVDKKDVTAMAESNPQLMVRLHMGLATRLTEALANA